MLKNNERISFINSGLNSGYQFIVIHLDLQRSWDKELAYD